MPSMESLPVQAIPCKVVGCPTHKAVMFFMLVVIHGLCHSQTQALNDVWLRHPRVQRLRVTLEQLLLSKHCHLPHRTGVPPVLVLISIRRPLPPVCVCEGWHTSIFLARVYNMSKLALTCSPSGNSATVNSKACHRLGARPW